MFGNKGAINFFQIKSCFPGKDRMESPCDYKFDEKDRDYKEE
jgi:hypothetical protein